MPPYTLEVRKIFPQMGLGRGETVTFAPDEPVPLSTDTRPIWSRYGLVSLAGYLLLGLVSEALAPSPDQRAEVFAAAQRYMRRVAGIPEPGPVPTRDELDDWLATLADPDASTLTEANGHELTWQADERDRRGPGDDADNWKR